MSHSSTYPTIFAHVLRYKNDTLDENPSTELTAIYQEYDFWIGAALSYFATYCNQPILSASTVFTMDFNCLKVSDYGSYYLLPVLKVPITISSVTYKTTVFGDATAIGTDARTLVNESGLQKLYFSDPPTDAIGTITATVGYADSDMPKDLIKIIQEIVTVTFDESGFASSKKRLGKLSIGESVQGVNVSTTYFQLSNRHNEVLDKYKVPIIV